MENFRPGVLVDESKQQVRCWNCGFLQAIEGLIGVVKDPIPFGDRYTDLHCPTCKALLTNPLLRE